ncbi:MAG: hypothetical protein M1838_002155 [Thelocarpon superellum]|nr:MAG: hypothetical protein M1838_002155 [Thelocarpon superellum]
MPTGRRNTAGAPNSRSRPHRNPQKRSLDALAIASREAPERFKVRQHRLGEIDRQSAPEVRTHADQEEDGHDGPTHTRSKRRRLDPRTVPDGEALVEKFSDSEGNEWQTGQVPSDQDSDIDSDEAFDDADEHRFEGYSFRGSAQARQAGGLGRRQPATNADLDETNEPEPGFEDKDEDADDLGDEAVDLAEALDASEDDEEGAAESEQLDGSSDDDEDGNGDSDATSDSSVSIDGSIEDDDGDSPHRVAALRNLVASLDSPIEPASGTRRRHDANDLSTKPLQKLTVADLLPSVTDATLRKSLRMMSTNKAPTGLTPNGGIPGKLEAPLVKRQQDRLNRVAAYDKSKETLDRWIDTVKHNRRAEYLAFPLTQANGRGTPGKDRLLPTTGPGASSALESTIQSILEQSGLAMSSSTAGEERIRQFEELQTNEMPLEEVQARRAQLRMARELLFREEVRAKRIKKIKSKSYRRVHRKQRERMEAATQAALVAGGAVESEDEREAAHRRRATERMGARHRESTWAKGVRASGRAAWDEDARMGVTEMAQRGEDLRQRMQGTSTRDGADDLSHPSSDSSDEVDDSEDDGEHSTRARNALLGQLDHSDAQAGSDEVHRAARSGLASMNFMVKAEAARKAENDAAASALRRELEGVASAEEADEAKPTGRRHYGPQLPNTPAHPVVRQSRASDFEEGVAFEDDESPRPSKATTGDGDSRTGLDALSPSQVSLGKVPDRAQRSIRKDAVATSHSTATKDNATKTAPSRVPDATAPRKHKSSGDAESVEARNDAVIAAHDTSEDSGSDDLDGIPPSQTQQALRLRAFAGDDVAQDFQAEKNKTVEEEDEQIIDHTLPGWGSWTGDGISKKAQKRNQGRFVTKTEGIRAEKRKDAKLNRVIINERRVKKNTKYLASSLPHPFESRQQYERSLRLPVGPEWTTKETFQDATKPRVLLRQGIIAPMERPLL